MQQDLESGQKRALILKHAVATDVGLKRTENQDSFKIINKNNITVFLVADGMGGAQGGKMASSMAADLFADAIAAIEELTEDVLEQIILTIHQTILDRSLQDPDLNGMGTTLVGLAFEGPKLLYFNVGDSRLYFISGNQISRLTKDHTVVQELLNSGAISVEQAKNHPVAHMLTRSLGASSDLAVDTFQMQQSLRTGDKFLICSDGLHGAVEDQEICEILEQNELSKSVACLVDLANERGGKDNVTVLAVEIAESSAIDSSDKNSRDDSASSKEGHSLQNSKPISSNLRPFIIVAAFVSLAVLACGLLFNKFGATGSFQESADEVPAKVTVSADLKVTVEPSADVKQQATQEPKVVTMPTVADSQIKEIDKALEAADQSLKHYINEVQSQIDLLQAKRKYFVLGRDGLSEELKKLESSRELQKNQIEQIERQIESIHLKQTKLDAIVSQKVETNTLIIANQLSLISDNINPYLEAFNASTKDYLRLIEEKKLREADPLTEQNFQDALIQRNKRLAELKSAIDSLIENTVAEQKKELSELPIALQSSQDALKLFDKQIQDLTLFLKEIELISDPLQKQTAIDEIDRQLEDLQKKQKS